MEGMVDPKRRAIKIGKLLQHLVVGFLGSSGCIILRVGVWLALVDICGGGMLQRDDYREISRLLVNKTRETRCVSRYITIINQHNSRPIWTSYRQSYHTKYRFIIIGQVNELRSSHSASDTPQHQKPRDVFLPNATESKK